MAARSSSIWAGIAPPTRAFLSAAAAWTLAAVAATGCAVGEPALETDVGSGGFAMQVGALAACGGDANKNPFPDLTTFRLVVREPQPDGSLKRIYNEIASLASDRSITFKQVPAKQKLEVSLLGFGPGATEPKWFARKSGVNVPKTLTSQLDLVLMAVEDFTCLPNPSSGAAPNVVFANTTRIDSGRVLITGGFAHVQPTDKADPTKGSDLGSPRDIAYIFDPATGTLTQTKGKMYEPRGGHTAIYLAKSNQVLIVGGAQKMRLRPDGTPPTWQQTDGTNSPFEIYDVASDKFLPGPGVEFGHKRVLPTLMPLANDLIAVIGGGPWPLVDDPVYRYADLFDPAAGGYVDPKGQLAMISARAGSALAYVGPTAAGTSRYLVWGGNALHTIAQNDPVSGTTVPFAIEPWPIAERFKESTVAGVGEFNADFVLTDEPGGDVVKDFKTSGLFFPTLTALGPVPAKDVVPNSVWAEDVRFLSVGGVRATQALNQPAVWKAPDPKDVFLLTLHEATEMTKGRITVKRLAGLTAGVYLHQTNLSGGNVVVSGGFSAYGQPASFAMQAFDVAGKAWRPATALPAANRFVQRGGHSSLVLSNDCLMMFGGVAKFDDLLQNGVAAPADVYCSKLLMPPYGEIL